MDDGSNKRDPVGDRYFRPLSRADACDVGLFYLSAALSIAIIFVDKTKMPNIYSMTQIAFAVSVVSLFISGLSIKLYFFPRAQVRRYQDFLAHAYGQSLSHMQTEAYYNNASPSVSGRIAAQVLESSFFSLDTLSRMVAFERIRTAIYALIWVVAILNRTTDLAVIGVAAQIIFSEQIISRWVRTEWSRRECEKTYDDLFRLFQSKGALDIHSLELLGRYEIGKATAAISLSSSIFERNRLRMNKEWEGVRKTLGI